MEELQQADIQLEDANRMKDEFLATLYARDEDRVASFEAGFDAHIAKPVPLAELIRTVACLANR